VLPKPKKIFPRAGPDKTTPEYLARATPEPTRPRPPPQQFPRYQFEES